MTARGSEPPAPPPPSGAGTRGDEPDRADPSVVGLDPEQLDVLFRVADILRKLRYGTVVMSVQDGKVVQIEMAEKIRLP